MLTKGLTSTSAHLALPEEGVIQQHTQLAGRPSSICCLAPSCSISELTSTAIVQGNGPYQETGQSYSSYAMQCYHNQTCDPVLCQIGCEQHRVTSLKPARQTHLLCIGLQSFQDLLHAMLLVWLPFEGLGQSLTKGR